MVSIGAVDQELNHRVRKAPGSRRYSSHEPHNSLIG
jgi:hypothetical protein